ncbi:hypothetical protein HMPREF1989_01384 [Porphyromonas gingivalis F0566]|nr:hypothetical protein HMPREF1989_01384 [Porphyromonas gingivalis F0566]
MEMDHALALTMEMGHVQISTMVMASVQETLIMVMDYANMFPSLLLSVK